MDPMWTGWLGVLPLCSAWLCRLRVAWRVLLVLVVAAVAGLQAVEVAPHSGAALGAGRVAASRMAPPTGAEYDVDVVLIRSGVSEVHTLSGTLTWWTGTWAGKVPFWRPISSLLFWAEWHAFGERYGRWALVSIALSVLLAMAMLWAFTPLLGECRALAATLVVFGGLCTPWDRWHLIHRVVGAWKNQPDLLAGLGVLGAVGFGVRGRAGLALTAAAFAAAIKEIGFAAFVLAPLAAYWHQRVNGRPCPWRRLTAVSAAGGLALLAWHYHAVGLGYQIGTNAHWADRALNFYGGTAIGVARTEEWWLVPLAVLCVAAGRRFPERPIPMLGAMLAGAALTVLAAMRQYEEPPDVAIAALFLRAPQLLALVAWILAAWVAVTRARPVALLGLAWMLVGAAPTFAATQTGMHTRWLGLVGQAIIAAGVIQAASEMAADAWRRWQARPADVPVGETQR